MPNSQPPGLPSPPPDGNGRVAHVYMDESNFRIGGEAANKKRRSIEFKERLSWHDDIRVLKGIIRKGSSITMDDSVFFNVYGSNLNHLRPLYRDLNLHASKVLNLPRNKNNQEKQVDTSLVKDMTDIVTTYRTTNVSAVFSVISGDSDMIPAVKHAISNGYAVHVWSRATSTSREYRRLHRYSKWGGLVTLTYLDGLLDSLTLSNSSIALGSIFIPPNGVVFVDPQDHKFDVVNRAGKLNAGNVIFTKRLNDGFHACTDVIFVSKKNPPHQDKVLRSMLKSLDRKGREAMSFAEYFHSSKHFELDGPLGRQENLEP
ncbi:hypothetical protein FGADI_6295 [Fusarium gaditjirri]|uniref:NYN domain-containing protein n=1 Tax=Fusarium gaditjirri TaxID=282569 RepID=A0A8H4T7Y7_9HYPO|nr:hypothetical protein FGADI_6295 [Fusarium gaditjirri]